MKKNPLALPYVYRADHKTDGTYYIGYEKKNEVPGSESIGILYFTSSKDVSSHPNEFNYTVIREFHCWQEAKLYEDLLIWEAKKIKKDKKCLNKHYGNPDTGEVEFSFSGRQHTKEWKKNQSKQMLGENNPMFGADRAGENNPAWNTIWIYSSKLNKHKRILSEDLPVYLNGGWIEGRVGIKGENNPMFGKHQTDYCKQRAREANTGRIESKETRKKKSESHKGENNSMFGNHNIFIHSATEKRIIRIKPEELQSYLDKGWVKGRKKF